MMTRTGYTVRRIERGDNDEVAALVTESFAEEISLARLSTGVVQNQIRSAVAASRPPVSLLLRAAGLTFEFWVATDGTRALGCYALHGRSLVTLANLAVRPDRRGQGIGCALVGHAFERAHQLERRRINLEVLADNEPAVRLYNRMGLQVYDCRRSYSIGLRPGLIDAPANPSVQLVPISHDHVRSWPAVLAASVPPEALVFEKTYRAEYVPRFLGRWLGERLPPTYSVRRTILVDGDVAGFVSVRVPLRQPLADVHVPLYLPTAAPVLPDIIRAATLLAVGRATFCRLYLSESRVEGHSAAELVGYEAERLWLYMYRDL